MSREKLAHVRGLILDLDNTLYHHGEEFNTACDIAAAHTVRSMGYPGSVEEAQRLAKESYQTHGSTFKVFADMGFSYDQFHGPYHDAVSLDCLEGDPQITEGLAALNMPMIILTNASRPWARRITKHINIGHIFGDGKIICLEDVGVAKSSGPDGFEKALSHLGLPPGQVLVVEDLARNLVHAKRLGMTTALVHNETVPDEWKDSVDVVYDKTRRLLRDLPVLQVPGYSAALSSAPS